MTESTSITATPLNARDLAGYRESATTHADRFDPAENHCVLRLLATIDLDRGSLNIAETLLTSWLYYGSMDGDDMRRLEESTADWLATKHEADFPPDPDADEEYPF